MSDVMYQVDAFTSQPFKGNPAGVCLLTSTKSDTWMQAVAKEMNLSETAFLKPEDGGWRLRWFTPTTEVDLCGHATLASAKVLFDQHPELRANVIQFMTRSGKLLAQWENGQVTLEFPAMVYKPFSFESEISRILGFQPVSAVFSGTYFLFEAENEQDIRQAAPDIDALEKLPMPEVIITARSVHPGIDFVSRFFAPQLGIDEDPVTGSAHCLLAPFWAEKMGQQTFDAYQASERGGYLHLRLVDDRVLISGDAVIILKAEWLL